MGCAHTKINSMIGMTPLVLFLSSYMPLFLLIAIRQIIKFQCCHLGRRLYAFSSNFVKELWYGNNMYFSCIVWSMGDICNF